ncbi:phage tail fiber assembly protein [Escherichia coli]|nr:phage tail fiber assembly protein [Escherichia coli]
MHIKNFRQYTPENPDVPGAMYLKSEDGQDWVSVNGAPY